MSEPKREVGPLIFLRKSSGLLMITTVPAGATITINNKVQRDITPTQINLPPGSYVVKVEKDGKSVVDQVQISEGKLNYVKIPLE